MSFIFAAKKPTEFNEHPQYFGTTTVSDYTCYQLNSGNYDSPLFSENEIWFSVWGGSLGNGNISYHNYYIMSADSNVSVRRVNGTTGGVYVNNSDTGERIAWKTGLNPWLFHVKSGVSDGIFEVYYDGNQAYATEDANILNGAPITSVRLTGGQGTIRMIMRDAVVATHEIPCGLLLEEVAADISALNGWTQSGTELSTETAGSTFTMKPNAAAIATLSATKSIDGILPSFSGAASENVSSIDVNSDDTITLSTTSTDYAGKVRTLVEANAGLTVEAAA